eukprot:GHVU01097063.1.p2 GENE.GHVU01097063.1~~GHVU01097063.1.p2  ORF type:complete len:113 (-),score=2.14 GHVU01097063.1:166-504(-)
MTYRAVPVEMLKQLLPFRIQYHSLPTSTLVEVHIRTQPHLLRQQRLAKLPPWLNSFLDKIGMDASTDFPQLVDRSADVHVALRHNKSAPVWLFQSGCARTYAADLLPVRTFR